MSNKSPVTQEATGLYLLQCPDETAHKKKTLLYSDVFYVRTPAHKKRHCFTAMSFMFGRLLTKKDIALQRCLLSLDDCSQKKDIALQRCLLSLDDCSQKKDIALQRCLLCLDDCSQKKTLLYSDVFYGCPDGLGLFYRNSKKFQNVSNY